MAGVTTFITMAYIIAVQPAVLCTDFSGNPTGLDHGAVVLATCLSAAFATLMMGLYANYPIALAPGMGENFFFVSTIIALKGMGIINAWQTAMGIVFSSGIIFVFISLLQLRETLFNAITPSLRNGMAAGIGLFIAFIGLQRGGIINSSPPTSVGLNCPIFKSDNVVDVIVFLIGLAVAGGLQARQIKGSILIGIVVSAITAVTFGRLKPTEIFGLPSINDNIILKIDIASALSPALIPYIMLFLFMDVFDTMGTVAGVAEQANLIINNRIKDVDKVFLTDACGTVFGACVGTSTVTSYIESSAGIACGGRTGLASVVTGILFLVALFISPLIKVIALYPPVTACALVIVGSLMLNNVTKIEWNDFSEAFPAFLIIIGIPLTYSIADGLSLGLFMYPITKLLCGKIREVRPVLYITALIIVAYFLFVRMKLI